MNIKIPHSYLLALLFIGFCPEALAQTTESPQSVTVDGRLFEPGSTEPLLDNGIILKVQVMNPARTCIIYEEQHTVNTVATNGFFNVQVGSAIGDPRRSILDSANSMTTVFYNSTTAIAGKTSVGANCSYTPMTQDVRYFRFLIQPPGTPTPVALSPDMLVDSVPQALVAQTLQGLSKEDVFKTSATSTQAKLDNLLTTNYNNLTDIMGGSSNLYMRNSTTGTILPNRPGDPSSPTDGQMWFDTSTNQIKYFNGSTIEAVGDAGAGITSIVAGSGLEGGTITTSGTISIASGGVTNAMLASGISASKITTGTLPVGVVPTGTDDTKLPLVGGTMTGAITMGADTTFSGYDLLGVGHITMNSQRTITLGRYSTAQQTALIGTLSGANAGATWYNSTTNKLMFWNGSAAFEVAETTSGGGDITAVNTNSGSGLTGGNTSGPVTLAINVDNNTLEIATNTVRVKDSGIDSQKISDNAITTQKLADGAITAEKIADDEITDAKIDSVNITKITAGPGDYFNYMPAGTECANDQVLKWDTTLNRWLCGNDIPGVTDHGALTGNSDDDHTQYIMLAGRAGGQSLFGGVNSGEDLTISSTGHATKGDVLLQPSGGNVGIGTTTPAGILHIKTAAPFMYIESGGGAFDNSAIQFRTSSAAKWDINAYSSAHPSNDIKNAFEISQRSNSAGLPLNTSRIFIKDNGNVGIGTTNPASKLAVAGRIETSGGMLFSQGAGPADNLMYLQSTSPGAVDGSLGFFAAGVGSTGGAQGPYFLARGNDFSAIGNQRGNLYFFAGTPSSPGPTEGSVVFATGALDTERMRISSNGNIGIGTTTPSVSLDVGAKTDALRIPAGTTAQQPSGANGMARYNTTDNKFEFYENGTWVRYGSSGAASSTFAGGTGSAATPSISFAGDPDTGFYNSSSTGTIGVTSNGAGIFNFSSSGLVSATAGGGVVTTANGTASSPTFSFSGDNDTGWFSPAADTLSASTSGSERVRIDSAGRVGIGTTNPTAPLEVSGKGVFQRGDVSGLGARSDLGLDIKGGAFSNNLLQIGFGYSGSANYAPGAMGLVVDSGAGMTKGSIFFATRDVTSDTAPVERMRISSDGNVGIGTTNPSQMLTVNGTIYSLSGGVKYPDGNTQSYAASMYVSPTDGYSRSTYVGPNVAAHPFLSHNNSNNAFGDGALRYLTTGARNVAFGPYALGWITTGSGNVGIGDQACQNVTTGSNNICLGSNATVPSISGSNQISINNLIYAINGNVGIGTTAPSTSLDLNTKTDAIRLPAGTTAQQPAAANGMIRYNTTNNKFEGFENGAWVNLRAPADNSNLVSATGTPAAPSMSFTGESDTGFYNSGTNAIGVSAGGAQVFSFNTTGMISPTAGGGNIRTGNGTAATPTYAFSGDSDTGWFSPAADTLAASTAGSEKMRIDSSGRVGIGTTTPHENFVVANGSSMSILSDPAGISFYKFADGTSGPSSYVGSISYNHANDSMGFATNGLQKMTITSAGDVGIATTNPSSTLHVVGSTTRAIQGISSGSNTGVYGTSSSGSGLAGLSTTGSGVRGDSTSGTGVFGNSSSNSGVQGSSATYAGVYGTSSGTGAGVRGESASGIAGHFITTSGYAGIFSGGNVGIGTASPRAALDVAGAVLHKPATSNATTTIDFGSGNLQYTSQSCQAYALHNMKDGGSYMFVVQGTTSATCSFTAFTGVGTGALSVRLPPDHGNTVATKHTVYNMVVLGTTVYVSWIPGY